MKEIDRPIVLASQSPRRRKLLRMMGISFEKCQPMVEDEEKYICSQSLEQSLQTLACVKAQSIGNIKKTSLVLGYDTVVVLDNCVLGKPADRQNAKEMLRRLSGRMHKVYSGVAFVCVDCNFQKTAVACTEVFFRDLAEDEIEDYLSFNEYADKAGAYAIQGRAMTFVAKINGCFYNVVGLPIAETISLFTTYCEFRKGLRDV